jgi:uncharacterized protein YjdB
LANNIGRKNQKSIQQMSGIVGVKIQENAHSLNPDKMDQAVTP